MQVIEFKGKQKTLDKWVYGYYVFNKADNGCYIFNDNGNGNLVFPESVGQYLGIADVGHNKIYKGDFLRHNENIFEVIYNEPNFCYLLVDVKKPDTNWRDLKWLNRVSKYIKIIGNRFDNPELLEAK